MRDVAVLSAHGGPGRRSARDRASHVNDVDDGSLLWRAAHTVPYGIAAYSSAGSTALGQWVRTSCAPPLTVRADSGAAGARDGWRCSPDAADLR